MTKALSGPGASAFQGSVEDPQIVLAGAAPVTLEIPEPTPLLPESADESAATVAPVDVRERLPRPAATQPLKLAWGHLASVVAIHGLAALALVPWFFSWTGLALAVAGHFFFGMLGITVGYHRLLTHRGFACPRWLEHFFATLGVCCLQDSPARWVAIHRMHHQHSDDQPDPHSPLVSFLWSHMGWLFVDHREHSSCLRFESYARDLLRDRFYLRFERKLIWLWTYVAHAALFYFAGLLIGRLAWGSWTAGLQFGGSLLIWGVFVRTVLVWHVTWSVNSVTHLWGYRNYETRENSRNHWLVGLSAHGEGWHNNHHADQRSARHGHKWWELDMTWGVIRCLELVGLATDVVRPRVTKQTLAARPADGD